MQRLRLFLATVFLVIAHVSHAQTANEVVWVQIVARPTYDQALEQVQDYAQALPDVNGFTLQGGWYAIALGPYLPADAAEVLRSYRAQGLIPRDSYVAQSQTYAQQYWPPGSDLLGLGNIAALTTPVPNAVEPAEPSEPAPETTAPAEIAAADETPNEARRNERNLTASERTQIQTALQWAGFYASTIDGAFGRGTRNAMAAWQTANGFERTGILTTAQRAELLGQYNSVLEGLDLALVRDLEAGIEIRLPTGAVAFESYDPPFAQYNATGSLEARVLLISQAGDLATLASLYEIMQTLRIVPVDGPRRLNRTNFTLEGADEDIVSYTEVSLRDGEIKGFTLIWPTGDEERRARVLDEMRASIVRRTGVIDATRSLPEDTRQDLAAGLEVRKPVLSRSGFYVDQRGTVVTAADGVQSCDRITLDSLYDATLSEVDTLGGIAILKPTERLAPPVVAEFSPAPPRLQSEIAVAGYSFQGRLGAASLTFGTLADLTGLAGETEVNRLSVTSLPGDVGGPVIDENGHVFGMLLPLPGGDRRLPEEVRFALTGEVLSGALTRAGLAPQTGLETAQLAPEDIADRGIGMTVLVDCWE